MLFQTILLSEVKDKEYQHLKETDVILLIVSST